MRGTDGMWSCTIRQWWGYIAGRPGIFYHCENQRENGETRNVHGLLMFTFLRKSVWGKRRCLLIAGIVTER